MCVCLFEYEFKRLILKDCMITTLIAMTEFLWIQVENCSSDITGAGHGKKNQTLIPPAKMAGNNSLDAASSC